MVCGNLALVFPTTPYRDVSRAKALSPLGGGERHFVVQPDDRQAEERDAMLGAQHTFIVHVDMKQFVKCLDVAYAPMLGPRSHQPVKSGPSPHRTGRVEAK